MAKNRKTSVQDISKIMLPGIVLKDLLELEEILPTLRENLTKVAFAITLLAQLANSLPNIKSSEILAMESTNTYIKKLLSKSTHTIYVSAAIAIRKTMAAYAEIEDPNVIVNDHNDLCTSLYGPSSTKGGVSVALSSPERLRTYRRGLMIQATGIWQTLPIFTPLKISKDINEITIANFNQALPFDIEDATVLELTSEFKELLDTKAFTDLYAPESKITLLEEYLEVSRTEAVLPPPSDLSETEIKKLPAWKRASIKQTLEINKKKKK